MGASRSTRGVDHGLNGGAFGVGAVIELSDAGKAHVQRCIDDPKYFQEHLRVQRERLQPRIKHLLKDDPELD